MNLNKLKWLRRAGNGWEGVEIARNGQKWLEMAGKARYGLKWLENEMGWTYHSFDCVTLFETKNVKINYLMNKVEK